MFKLTYSYSLCLTDCMCAAFSVIFIKRNYKRLNGTMSRDFRAPFLSKKTLYLGPLWIGYKQFCYNFRLCKYIRKIRMPCFRPFNVLHKGLKRMSVCTIKKCCKFSYTVPLESERVYKYCNLITAFVGMFSASSI